ncbi:MAG: hypothetical protein EZS28_044238, partial [Streblomastix strix]
MNNQKFNDEVTTISGVLDFQINEEGVIVYLDVLVDVFVDAVIDEYYDKEERGVDIGALIT